MKIDMYDGHKIEDADRIGIFFDNNGDYWGWIYMNGDIIGDFNADGCEEIENAFKQFQINWR